jgi:hypothetical protein
MPRAKVTSPRPGPIQGESAQATMRLEHPGKWLAWTEDEGSTVAVGDTVEEVRTIAGQAGHSRFIYDWVPPAEGRQTSGPA